MQEIRFQVGNSTIPYYLGHDCARDIVRQITHILPKVEKSLVIADQAVWHYHSNRFMAAFERGCEFSVMTIYSKEELKTLSTVEKIIQYAIGCGITANSALIAIGGGVVGNIAGLASALLFRGISFIEIPTTLLAMHDSVSSLKQGVNFCKLKNMVGTFYKPCAVFSDLLFLQTLPEKEIRSGMAELVKNILIFNDDMNEVKAFADVNANKAFPEKWLNLIQFGLMAKQRLLMADPYEKGTGLLFEYGHTVGHALELTFQDDITHGDAVAWGMRCAGLIAYKMGLMDQLSYRAHEKTLKEIGPLPDIKGLSAHSLMQKIKQDNKRGRLFNVHDDEYPFVLLRKPGVPVAAGSGIPLVAVNKNILEGALFDLANN